jgi:hypothetical protein
MVESHTTILEATLSTIVVSPADTMSTLRGDVRQFAGVTAVSVPLHVARQPAMQRFATPQANAAVGAAPKRAPPGGLT